VVGILLSSLFTFPQNAYASCVNFIQSQAISAAYEGDAQPTVNHMDTCSGDDTSYQIPIATTITFDGVQYSNIYATTNSVITFGQPDGTYWNYPQTPSISLYSMDWFPGVSGTSGLDIYYSEGGFQLNLNMVPFGNYNAQPSTVNILVAITNTGGISVAYSYQGPEYNNLRTGVRLHDGSIVSLEAWGATQVQSTASMPTLQAEPVSEPVVPITPSPTPTPTPSPTEPPATPEEQQAEAIEATQLASDIASINELIISAANATDSDVVEPDPLPSTDPNPEPVDEPQPDVVVEPEVITPEDPRFPEDIDEQTPQDETTLTPDPETTLEPVPDPEPSVEPEPQTEDTVVDEVVEPVVGPAPIEDIKTYINSTTMGISEDEAKKLVALAANNATLATAIQEFASRSEENKTDVLPYTLADATTEVQAEAFIKAVSVENLSKILSNPAEAVGALLGNTAELLSNFSELGNDMTDDQREKAQEAIIPVVIVSQIANSVMRRNK
jgi:hypothetical protein